MGLMESLTREQVRRIDRCAIEIVGVASTVLMENAGRNAADAIQQFLSGLPGSPVVGVVCGGGNNGGDGFVIARHLAMRGMKVVTFLVVEADRPRGDAAVNLSILRKLDHDVRAISGRLADLSDGLADVELIVDAVGGTGIRGALDGEMGDVVERINAARKPVVAVDIPTGLDCDTGQAAGPAVRANVTVTFVAPKKGFDAPGAAEYTGRVVVADIGVPADLVARIAARDD